MSEQGEAQREEARQNLRDARGFGNNWITTGQRLEISSVQISPSQLYGFPAPSSRLAECACMENGISRYAKAESGSRGLFYVLTSFKRRGDRVGQPTAEARIVCVPRPARRPGASLSPSSTSSSQHGALPTVPLATTRHGVYSEFVFFTNTSRPDPPWACRCTVGGEGFRTWRAVGSEDSPLISPVYPRDGHLALVIHEV